MCKKHINNAFDLCYKTGESDITKAIAEELIKYYQPKIPEGSMVLSKKEFEALKSKETLKSWIYQDGFDAAKELYAEALARMRDDVINIKEELKEARKETAREIFKGGRAYAEEYKDFLGVGFGMFMSWIATHFGVELEE